MAIEVLIKQKGLFKKEPTISTIKKITGDKFLLGVRNSAYVFDDYTNKEMGDNQIVLMSPDKIGRGFFAYKKGNDLGVVLNTPSTSKDISDFYNFVEKACLNWGVKQFLQDDEVISLSAIDEMKNSVTKWNLNNLSQLLKQTQESSSCFITFGANNPIYMEEDVQNNISPLEGEELEQAFANYLDKQQQHDYYYMKPSFYRDKTGDIFASYTLTQGVDSIIPMKPYIPIPSEISPDTPVDRWLLSLVVEDGNSYSMAGEVEYNQFIESIPADLLEVYDRDHWLLKGVSKDFMTNLLAE